MAKASESESAADKILEYVQRERAAGFANLQGLVVAGSIPIRETVLNEFVQAAMADVSTPVRRLQISILDYNRLRVQAEVKFLVTLTQDLELEIEPTVLMSHSPLLKIKVMRGGGLVMRLVEVMIPLLGLVPESITMVNQLITINLKVAFTRHGYGDLAPLLQLVRIKTEQGLAQVDFLAKIPDAVKLPESSPATDK